MASPATSEQPENSGASAQSQRIEEEDHRRDAEVSSGGNGDGERTVAIEDEAPEQGGAESSKASQELEKKKKGLPKGRWLPPQIRQDHIDQLIEDAKLRANYGYRLPKVDRKSVV